MRNDLLRRIALSGVVALALGFGPSNSPSTPALAQSLITTVSVGSQPAGVAVNPSTNRIYVSNQPDGTVSVIDGTTNTVISTIPVGALPAGVGVNPTTNKIYVANFGDTLAGTISVIDGATNSVIKTVPAGSADPQSVAVNPTTNRIYYTDFAGVGVIDGTTDTVVATFELGTPPPGTLFPPPIAVAVDPSRNRVYLTDNRPLVFIVDGATDNLLGSDPTGAVPDGVGVNPQTDRLFVANLLDQDLTVIDQSTNSVVATVPVGHQPDAVDVDAAADRVYVTNQQDGTLSVINGSTNSVIATVNVGTHPSGVAVNPVTHLVYAVSPSGTVTVIQGALDTTTPTTTVSLNPPSPNGQNGWYTGPVAPSVSATDSDDAAFTIQTRCVLDPAGPPANFAALPSTPCAYLGSGPGVGANGQHILYAASQDLVGNTGPITGISFRIDSIVPDALPSTTPPTNTAGWNNSDVTVTWNWSDTGSGLAPGSCPATSTSSGEGSIVLQATCLDIAGNGTIAVVTAKIDKTAPTISAAATTQPNANGWYNGNATVHFTCNDALSGVASCPADQVLSTEGSAVSSTAQTARDLAGNTSVASNVVTLAIDKTAPVVTVTGVTDKAVYTIGNVPTPGCGTTDALSGVATPASVQITGGTSNEVGSFTATCSGATDKAGNAATPVSASYTVRYSFGGFGAPLAGPPAVNTGKAGRAFAVRFQLTNATGGFISSLSAVTSVTYESTSCDAFPGTPNNALAASTPGDVGLHYDSAANQFIFPWASPSTSGCFALFVTLDSGQVFTADFNLS